MMKYKKLVVLYNDDINAVADLYKKDIENTLKEYEIEINDKNILLEAETIINNDYDDLITSLNTYDYLCNYDYILVEYSLGLWYGRRTGKARFKTLKEAILSGSYDYNIIYFDDDKTTIKKASQHHDGENVYKYYKVVKGKKYAIKYNDFIDCML